MGKEDKSGEERSGNKDQAAGLTIKLTLEGLRRLTLSLLQSSCVRPKHVFRAVQYSNISHILLSSVLSTLLVSKLLKSKVSKEEQNWNIERIMITFLVSKLL